MNWKCISTVASATLLAISTSAFAVLTPINASQDTTIFGDHTSSAFGGGNVIFSGTNGTSAKRRGLIEFNMATSGIPSDATITSVQLSLSFQMAAGSGGGSGGGGDGSSTPPANITIGLYDASQDWGEGTAGTGSTSGSGTSAGATGDATWSSAKLNQATWTTPGGDFSLTASATLTEPSASLPSTFVWGSTPAMVNDVQGWLTSPSSNHGWFLINSDETNPVTFLSFWSKDNPTASLRPQLIVTYTPEPSSLLAGLGMLSLLQRRRLK